jgi:hypothetical protein
MRALGITTVYDLRSDAEMAKYNTPMPAIPSVRVLHVPVFQQKDYSPTHMARRFQMYASGRIEVSTPRACRAGEKIYVRGRGGCRHS